MDANELTNGEHDIVEWQAKIELCQITYVCQDIALGPTGKVILSSFPIGRSAIACKYMPEGLQEQIEGFVRLAEELLDNENE